MRLAHIHLPVHDLDATLAGFEKMFGLKPTYRDPHMAVLPAEPFPVIFDVETDACEGFLALASDDCDKDYQRLLSLGAVSKEPPQDNWWGTRSAYVQGPDNLIIELEQAKAKT